MKEQISKEKYNAKTVIYAKIEFNKNAMKRIKCYPIA